PVSPSRCRHVHPLVFLLAIPRPLRPTLFPYTTLFRSHLVQPRDHLRRRQHLVHAPAVGGAHVHVLDEAQDDRRALEVGATNGWRDRKSTRLNSSHVAISYAVFCLKKNSKSLESMSPIK